MSSVKLTSPVPWGYEDKVVVGVKDTAVAVLREPGLLRRANRLPWVDFDVVQCER